MPFRTTGELSSISPAAPQRHGHPEQSEGPAVLFPASAAQPGFSLIELLIVLVVLLTVSGIILTVIFQMAMSQGTVINRTEMHGGVRAATELLQQEIGQAGRVASPPLVTAPATLSTAVVGNATAQTPTVSSTAGLFPGEMVILGPHAVGGIDDASGVACPGVAPLFCAGRENITLTAVGATTVTTGLVQDPHTIGAPISVQGTFPAGVVPPTGNTLLSWCTAGCPAGVTPPDFAVTTLTAGVTPGSSATVLKMFGDINGDGRMVYVEYFCDTSTVPGTFSRRVIDFSTVLAKTTANFPWVALLTNLLVNPGGTPCFAYQTKVVRNDTYVTDVAVTLTVRTQNKDPQTGAYQNETKALLNVSPRNVYEAWQMASLPGGTTIRLQPMPQSVLNLLNP